MIFRFANEDHVMVSEDCDNNRTVEFIETVEVGQLPRGWIPSIA